MSFLDKMKDISDKAGKSASDAYEKHKEKVAATKEARGNTLKALSLDYMGGYNDYKKAKGVLTFYERQTEFSSPLSTKFTIGNGQVSNIVIEGKDDVSRRVTVTRLLAVGIFAFALKKKKKEKEAYLTLELSDGQEVIFFIDNNSPMELKTKLAKVISLVKQAGVSSSNAQTAQSHQMSVADELAKLAKLKEQGVITQAEFDKKKTELLS